MGWSDGDFARLGEEDVEALLRKLLEEGLSLPYVAQIVTAVRKAIRTAQGLNAKKVVRVKRLSGPQAMYRRSKGQGNLSDSTAILFSRLINAAKSRMGWSDDDFARLGEEDVEALKQKLLEERLSPAYVAQVIMVVRRAIRAAREAEEGS
jgi:DNA-binding phage protein